MECIPLQTKQWVVTQSFHVSNHKVTDRRTQMHFHNLLRNKRNIDAQRNDRLLAPGKQGTSAVTELDLYPLTSRHCLLPSRCRDTYDRNTDEMIHTQTVIHTDK